MFQNGERDEKTYAEVRLGAWCAFWVSFRGFFATASAKHDRSHRQRNSHRIVFGSGRTLAFPGNRNGHGSQGLFRHDQRCRRRGWAQTETHLLRRQLRSGEDRSVLQPSDGAERFRTRFFRGHSYRREVHPDGGGQQDSRGWAIHRSADAIRAAAALDCKCSRLLFR